MKKLLIGLLVAGLLFGTPAGCAMLVLGAAAGAASQAICQPDQAGSVSVVGDLPAVEGYSTAQITSAAVIITVAQERGLGAQGARIGLITALQESGLRNLANAGKFKYPVKGSKVMSEAEWNRLQPIIASSVNYPNDGVANGDWDSIGVFQGRFSIGTWSGEGTDEEKIRNLLNPSFTAARFFDALVKVEGWESMRPAAAAQAVQRSAFPDAYAKHWDTSAILLEALTGVQVSSTTAGACQAGTTTDSVTTQGWTRPITDYTSLSSAYGMRKHPVTGVTKLHAGQDFAAKRGTAIYAAAAGTVVKAGYAGAGTNGLNWVVIDHGSGILTRYLHSDEDGILVVVGQEVQAGEHIANVGMSGWTTGAHLHFEVSVNGQTVNPIPFLAERGVTY